MPQSRKLIALTFAVATGAWLLVKKDGSGNAVVCDAGDRPLGATTLDVGPTQNFQGSVAPLELSSRTFILTASKSFAAGATLYTAANGQVTDVDTGCQIGVANEAASGAGALVEVIPNLVLDYVIAGALYTNVAASTVVTNTTAATVFDKKVTIPAAALVAGALLKLRAAVNLPATHSTDTIALVLKLGSITLATIAAFDPANGDIGILEADVLIRTAGSSGTLVATTKTAGGTPGTVTPLPGAKASTAVDTTGALDVTVTATWSVADTGNQARLDQITAELFTP